MSSRPLVFLGLSVVDLALCSKIKAFVYLCFCSPVGRVLFSVNCNARDVGEAISYLTSQSSTGSIPGISHVGGIMGLCSTV